MGKQKANLTASEMGRLGARAQLRKYGHKQLREWGKLGGRPRKKAKKRKAPAGSARELP